MKAYESLVQLQETSCKKFGKHSLFGTRQADGSWRWTSFEEFGHLVDALRGGLASLGVGPGDKVAIAANNRLEWATAAYATYGLGAVFVPMYEAQLPEERKYILDDCEAKVALASSRELFDELTQCSAELPSLEHVIGLDIGDDEEKSYARLLQKGAEAKVPTHSVQGSDIAGLIYTSGTTGMPKGVVLSHKNFCSNVAAACERFDFGADDRALCFLPWAHSFGQTAELHTMLASGCAMAINDEIPNLITNLPVVKPTVLVAVPRIFNRIYDRVNKQMAERPAVIQKVFHAGIAASAKKKRGEALRLRERLVLRLADRLIFEKVRGRFGGRLRFVVSGSAALSKEVAEFIDALGIDVYEGYGLTETSPVVSANYPGHRKFGTVGPPFPGVTVTIDTEVTGDPKNGEIIVSGPNVMQGYHRQEEETARVLLPGGKFRTGDMGYIDDEGYLHITGRIKEQYKLENGRYVVPSPLEEQLKLSPYIANVMLHGANKPHNVALVVPDMDALKAWAEKAGKSLGDIEQNDDVRRLILAELKKYASSFKSYEVPKAAALTTEDFTTENGLLTPKMSLKRQNVLERYGTLLDSLYQ